MRVKNSLVDPAFNETVRHECTPFFLWGKRDIPNDRQIANVLRAEGYLFNLFTPGGSVRLMSDRSAEDYLELFLDTTEDPPRVTGRASRRRGSRVLESERPIGSPGPLRALTEEDVLGFVTKELEPFVER